MSISDLLASSTIELDLRAVDAGAATQTLASLLQRAGAVKDLDVYLGAVAAREALGTTAVGFGVAIPHAKSAGVARAAVAFGRSTGGLHWTSLDGEPVNLVFLIAAPEGGDDLHLRTLAQLARKLVHEEVRQRLMEAQSPQQVIAALQA